VLKRHQFIPLLIIAAGIWAYHNSFTVPFLFDDHSSVENNPTIRHLWPIWKALSPSPTSVVGGRPVVNLSLALNYALGGTDVWGYHAVNLAVHVLAGLTLYGIVRRTLARPGLRERFGAAAEWLALTVALIWTVHPLQTEAVTYISQRCESLTGLFYLLSLYGFIRGAESRRSVGWFTLSVAACWLGVACKEVMVTAPLLVLLYDRAFVSGTFGEAWTRHRRLYLGLASSWLLLGYLMAGLHNRGIGYEPGITWWGYALTECPAIVQYLRLAVWPHPLIFDYGEYVPTWHLAAVAPYALIVAVLASGVLFELKRHPAVGFVGAWFFVILAPTSSVVPIMGSPMAEHRMYLPLASVVTLIVVGAVALGKRLFHQQGVVLGCVVGGSVVVLLTFLTIQRNRDYNSEMAIWQDTVEKRPNNARARYNLGVILVEQGRLPEAIGQYEQALRIKPGYAEVHYNLGVALVQLGRLPEAIGHYEQALRIKADFADAHNNLGIALVQLGRLPEAIGHYEQALRIKPDFAVAHYNLGIALVGEGRLPEAIGHYEQALRIKPDDAETHNNLGNALLRAGNVPEAIGHYEQALRIKADFAEAHNNLGLALVQLGRLREAIEHWEQALRIKPEYADAHYNLGVAFEQAGRVQEAIGHYEQALRIKPDYVGAQNALARLQARQ
jgi:tetratricopeptide (TPR) repeat protein